MLDFIAMNFFCGLLATAAALKWPKKAPFLSEDKSRLDVLVRYGGFCLACFLLILILPRFGVDGGTMANQSSRYDATAQPAAAPPPTAEELQKQADERKKDAAFLTCRKLINGLVKDPLSVDVSTLSVVKNLRENGQVFVTIPFTAKNSFGQRRKMEATCHIWDGHDPKITLREL